MRVLDQSLQPQHPSLRSDTALLFIHCWRQFHDLSRELYESWHRLNVKLDNKRFLHPKFKKFTFPKFPNIPIVYNSVSV